MEQRKLISAVDYILHEERLKEDSDVAIFNVTNYANFLKQTPNIGDFVPAKEVDGVWIVLKEPKWVSPDGIDWLDYEKEYNEAKNRVIFDGFEVRQSDFERILINDKENKAVGTFIGNEFNFFNEFKTIEDLVKFNLIVTEEKAKELGLLKKNNNNVSWIYVRRGNRSKKH